MRVEQLGAHLEAYVTTLPNIITLRLCNRFGTGSECHINKLPVELVELIEEHIVALEREKALAIWSQQHKCNEKKCKALDHYSATKEQLYQRYHELIGPCTCGQEATCGTDHHHSCGHRLCADANAEPPGMLSRRDDSDYIILAQLVKLGYLPDSQKLCQSQQKKWQRGVGTVDKGPYYYYTQPFENGFFDEQKQLLHAHFGIIVWLGHSSLPSPNSRRGDTDLNPSYKTTAHLALPGSEMLRETWYPATTTGP